MLLKSSSVVGCFSSFPDARAHLNTVKWGTESIPIFSDSIFVLSPSRVRHAENAASSRNPGGLAVGSTAKVSSRVALRDRTEVFNRSTNPSW